MHGAGNDYVYVNSFNEHVGDPAALARYVSDRHFGIGSDGLVLIMPSEVADFRMRIFNADGSEAEMCGNASRCIGKYLHDYRLTDSTEIRLETGAGIKTLQLAIGPDGKVDRVRVNMGHPILKPADVPVDVAHLNGVIAADAPIVDAPILIDGVEERVTCVSMGNPHAVYFVDDVATLDLPALGPAHECHEAFPRRTNTEFVEVVSPDRVKMRVWERGSGETLACGTGCCATLVACVLNGRTARAAVVDVAGGELEIEWDEASGDVFMTGPATTVFDGTIEWEVDSPTPSQP